MSATLRRQVTKNLRPMVASATPYESWSREDLIARLTQLEAEKEPPLRVAITPPPPNPKRLWRTFDFASYPHPTPLPTVEGVLFEALAKARLIDPDAGLDGCGWERCGRTDRGVSAGGQVISLWVRSALDNAPSIPSPPDPISLPEEPEAANSDDAFPGLDGDFGSLDDMDFPLPTKVSRKSEHSYTLILNRLLPPTIRVLAWSPVAPEFSSRFACKSRHYKYFFAPDGLDIPLMSEAAALLVGGHDFRNFCKLDPAKQLTTYRRRIMSADINPVAAGMHVLDLKGSAFLYHQVRHIMAVLFLVGAGLEPPSVVTALLNVEHGAEGDPVLPVVDTRPEYQMADALPLMLYACHYTPGDVEWQAEEDVDADGLSPLGAGLYHQLHSIHARADMYATLNREFLQAAAAHHAPPTPHLPLTATGFVPDGRTPMNVPLGGAEFRRTAKYVPLLKRPRGDHFEIVNERWRVGKGARRDEQRRAAEDEE
ncbi:pseudouridine synthase [Mycena vulgaris]|nr:pseudouridine synthase [Mycena vulgaris]